MRRTVLIAAIAGLSACTEIGDSPFTLDAAQTADTAGDVPGDAVPDGTDVPDVVGPSGPTWEDDIFPLLDAKGCTQSFCHGNAKASGLEMTREGLFAGGDQGDAPAIVPCNVEASYLLQKVSDMPPFGSQMPLIGDKLTQDEVALLVEWVETGAQAAPFQAGACVAPPVDPVTWPDDILPIFQARGCNQSFCHGAAKSNGYDSRTREAAIAGGLNSPGVIPCDPEGGTLLDKLMPNPSFGTQMPLIGAKLTEEEIEAVREWIAQGALAEYDPNACPP